ncbi:hypothetical protein C8A05DRAFT_39102 [Staphylotrichum tortipilum]|uniref:Extracellular serine-rich protein n=1 Tax=Staphylotrichum tortipilum TaxID=2831512 RepID=A0AAN6RNV3_9PEZI|nr:hypothetical protein C8A05DRAFT_39102 [Staphylotrichum longicolle]
MLPPSITALLLAGAALAAATTIPVSVGKNGLTFDPSMIHASVGDVIEFRYWPLNHSVVAGDFSSACRPASSGGFYSGFFPTKAGTVNSQVFRVTVSHTNPVPIYCAQNTGQHCRNGMVAVINPSEAQTLESYASLARSAGNAVAPPGGPFGGVVAPASNPGGMGVSSSSSAASSTAHSSSSSSASGGSTSAAQTTTVTTPPASSTTGGSATTTTSKPSGTGNAAAGVAVPVAGLVAVAVGAFFV